MAIFFWLYSTSLFLDVKGPFILALVLYGFFDVLIFFSIVISLGLYILSAVGEIRKERPEWNLGTKKVIMEGSRRR